MRWVAVRKEQQNDAAVDPWTPVHLAAGLATGLVGWSFTFAMGVALAYEVVEQVVETTSRGQRFFRSSGPESALNSVSDLAAYALGHRLGRAWNEQTNAEEQTEAAERTRARRPAETGC